MATVSLGPALLSRLIYCSMRCPRWASKSCWSCITAHSHVCYHTTWVYTLFYTRYLYYLGDAEDVVAQYCQWNHTSHLPENTQLFTVCRQQTSPNSQSLLSAGGEVNCKGSVVSNLDIANVHPARAATDICPQPSSSSCKQPAAASGMSSVLAEDADPSQLQYYLLTVHDIIKHVKQFSHCDIASINLFLLHPDLNHKAVEYINEAIAK